jgi:hypothetical protein
MSNKPMPSRATAAPSGLPAPMRPPRDLSPLTRDRQAVATSKASSAAPAGAHGDLLFELAAHETGVHVQRIHRRDDGTKVCCSVLFDDERTFLDWLDADPMRFAHPLVFQQARRGFAQLMARKGSHDSARN